MTDAYADETIKKIERREAHRHRIAAGYPSRMETGFQPAISRERRKLEQAAARFEPNDAFERMLTWKKNDDPRFDQLPADLKMKLGFYQQDKNAGKALVEFDKEFGRGR